MATAVNKQKVLDHVVTALRKRYEVPEAAARNVLEHLLYSIVREGTTTEKADRAFQHLKQRFVDWNEVRVSTVQERAKKISRLNDSNDYAVAWVIQNGLGGHAIPLDGPSIRVLRRLGVLDGESESLESLRGTIEHFVPKIKGPAFVELLSQHADVLCVEENPRCGKCPLLEDCPTGQSLRGQEGSKPRKSR
jgi:endonuclease-3